MLKTILTKGLHVIDPPCRMPIALATDEQNKLKRIVIGLMKMGNMVPVAGIVPTSLAYQDSVLRITPPRHHVTTLPTPTCLDCSLHERSVQTTRYMYVRLKCYIQKPRPHTNVKQAHLV